MAVPGKLLDTVAWAAVLERLLQPRWFQSLPRREIALDASENPASRLGQLTKTREALAKKKANLVAADGTGGSS